MIEIHEIITASNFFLLYYPTILKLMAWEYFIWFVEKFWEITDEIYI
jgi:hypothetical protein